MQTKHVIIAIYAAILGLFSCKKENELATINNSANTETLRQEAAIPYKQDAVILGQKLNNPYTVQNMMLAANNISQGFSTFSVAEIKTTHLYVKFKPSNESQYEQLETNAALTIHSITKLYKTVTVITIPPCLPKHPPTNTLR
jgi:flagellar basal body rod protein FlgC